MNFRHWATALAAMGAVFLASPALADPDKDESGKRSYRHHDRYGDEGWHRGKRAEAKEEFWDGNCKVERKWEKNGEYKEERKCRGPQRVRDAEHVEHFPGVVIALPPVIITPH